MPEVLCRHFTGYKPCGFSVRCDANCKHRNVPKSRLLLVHLGALGAVLRSTSLLLPIKKKFPDCHITWVTDAPGNKLLENNPHVDRILTTDSSDLLALSSLEFDVAFVVDKSLKAAGVLRQTKVKKIYGFRVESITGAIVPATEAACELWEIGLSDQKKFFENKKTEVQLVAEALELPSGRSEYIVELTEKEKNIAADRRRLWAPRNELVIGLNTGCSPVIPYKKLSVEMHRQLAARLLAKNMSVVLLGGPEDTDRNEQIARGLPVHVSPTRQGIRDGFTSVQACDIVVTGDSLGMHMAISLKKWVVAWFGPTCAHEIELYNRGEYVLTSALCSPCWKRTCHKNPMCYDLVDLDLIMNGIQKGTMWLTSSSIQHSSETSFSASHSCAQSKRDFPAEI